MTAPPPFDCASTLNDPAASIETLDNACRTLLRNYRSLAVRGGQPSDEWRPLIHRALLFLGGQPERSTTSMRDYDCKRFGPFLAISNEGGGGATISKAANLTPKGVALGQNAAKISLGMAIDSERLGAIGEVPVGPEEFADIWFWAVDRLLMTTNVGSRANLRYYKPPPVVALGGGARIDVEAKALADLAAAFKPFLDAPGGSRPVTVYLETGDDRSIDEAAGIARALAAKLADGSIRTDAGHETDPGIHRLGIHVAPGAEADAEQRVADAMAVAAQAGLARIVVDGRQRLEANAPISLPGLLDFFAPDTVNRLLAHASGKNIELRPFNQVDPDTVARQIWSTLNTARAMGFDLGKYSLMPLTLEQSDAVIGLIQSWMADWSAAPVFYADQGLLTEDHFFAADDLEAGVEQWLRMVARHGVPLVLIDTVDKAKGWRLVKENGDPKGLLTVEQIGRLNKIAVGLGISAMWAGGLEGEQVYALGQLGVFGLYVTSAVCNPAPVFGDAYRRDPALAALKSPDRGKILATKRLLEAGFFASPQVALPPEISERLKAAGMDDQKLQSVLPDAWAAWWTAS